MSIELAEPDAAEASTSMELTVQDRACVALSSTKTREDLAQLVQQSATIVEIKDKAGREECHSRLMSLVRARTQIEKVSKAARDDALAFQKAVIAEEKSLCAITAAEESRLKGLRDEWDQAEQRRKEEEARRELERKRALQAAVDIIRSVPLSVVGKGSAEVQRAIDQLRTLEVGEAVFAEFRAAAIDAREWAIEKLAGMLEAARASEETQRVAAIQKRITEIREFLVTAAMARTSDRLAKLLERAKTVTVDATFQEFEQQAKVELVNVVNRLGVMVEEKRAAERAAAEAKAKAAVELAAAPSPEPATTAQAPAPAPTPVPAPQTAPAPVSVAAQAAPEGMPQRPSDELIVQTIADAFDVSTKVAYGWILEVQIEECKELTPNNRFS